MSGQKNLRNAYSCQLLNHTVLFTTWLSTLDDVMLFSRHSKTADEDKTDIFMSRNGSNAVILRNRH